MRPVTTVYKMLRLLAGGCLAANIAAGHSRAAESTQPSALIIDNQSPLEAQETNVCKHATSFVGQALTRYGYHVSHVDDGTALQVRIAIEKFAQDTRNATPLIYVCSDGAVLGDRLFLLPSDADAALPNALPTQGILLKALLHAMPAQGGILIADVKLSPSENPDPALAELQKSTAPSQRLAIFTGSMDDQAPAGKTIASNVGMPGNGLDWPAFVGIMRRESTFIGGASRIMLLNAAPAVSASSSTNLPVIAATPTTPAAPLSPAPTAATATKDADTPPSALTQTTANPSPAELGGKTASPGQTAPHHEKYRKPHEASVEDNRRIARIQIALLARGFYNGPITGVDNPGLRFAIRTFQTSLGDRQIGKLTPSEIAILLNGP